MSLFIQHILSTCLFYHLYLVEAKMKSGDDPHDFIYTMDGYRERLEDMD